MAIYKCPICGYLYDEGEHDQAFDSLGDDWVCPICSAPIELFEKLESDEVKVPEEVTIKETLHTYLSEYTKPNVKEERHMTLIHEMAKAGESITEAMSVTLPVVSWDDILILGAQLNPMPLEKEEVVSLKTVIGKLAKQPMTLETPVYISHMSFGALSKEVKIALAKGSASVGTAMCSGEGGVLPEEMAESSRYIFEYVPNLYSVSDDMLKNADAIEIKIGQGTKPGMGGHLPGAKVTEEIAKIRGKEAWEDVVSPSKFASIKNRDDLKSLVDDLRSRSLGRPIGIKIAAGHIEQDLEMVAYAGADFVTIDGRGGATGASLKIIKDSTSVPTIYALYRARKYLDKHNLPIDLVITGGLRLSSDFAKAIAMGADAVAIASSALMACACSQYRICNTGMCPVGVATQNEDLRSRLHIESSAKRLSNFLNVSNEELKTFARITGHHDIHELSSKDLITTNKEISKYTDIDHA